MKKAILVIGMLSAFTASASMESTPKFKLIGDMNYSKFCKAVLEDDISMFKYSLMKKVGMVASTRAGVLRKLVSADGMTCAGENLLTFAKTRDAQEVYAYLVQNS
ncbi:DUF3718 domain-containing protein [Alteromonadaceae bacterium BrNp21-10]|nr:DUF3718 domain-containing protein [Alteromonadaceae bacterium BrNp21-10]